MGSARREANDGKRTTGSERRARQPWHLEFLARAPTLRGGDPPTYRKAASALAAAIAAASRGSLNSVSGA